MSQNQNNDIDLVWEAAAIGRVINRTPRQTHHLLNSGAIEAARKVNGRWCADRNGLRAQFCAGTGQATKRDAAVPAAEARARMPGAEPTVPASP